MAYLEEGVQACYTCPKPLWLTTLHSGLRGIYQDFPPFRFLGPFCRGYLDRKGKISSEVKPTDCPTPSPTQPPSSTKPLSLRGAMMKVGSLSEAYIATILSGNEVIGIHPMKTEEHTG